MVCRIRGIGMTKLSSLHDGTIVPSRFNITCAYAWLRDQYGCMAKRLKMIVSGVWVLLLLPMLATVFEKWLEQNFFSEPDAAATTVFNNLVMLGQESWFHFALVFFTGIVIGFSLDWLAHRSDENKASELRHLGTNFRRLSDSIKTQTSARSEWPDNIRDLKPDIVSAFISAEKFGLWVPGE